ncbi:exosome complex protein Rrp42 [Candidatus Woesearchaeota archaeon]|nr:exosome complex protein Rrp42 [Candidatus Woesearchaeota archaeon]MBT5272433.1 exosome complex protein Rrp42 [Candidatus Woesearchaeota archaeon]MBT6041225.1 exosome complex protein Rrp42 [Candidatus Woesearchaeota archaeon]MBT6337487.1 exosome complex protein Rrp42 [Candidatus Woesearchaeota archaeon]MBT7928200.1 exosome complex protein Rrp42 [Candidatus Woesearchaeota archaeon]
MNNDSKNHLIKSLEKGIRFDGRKLTDYRKVVVETGVSKNAEGSARVKFGDTEVVAGVKMMMEKPYPDTPEQGVIMVNAEFLPMASPEFESGPPGIDSIELSRVVDRGIRESKAIDLKKLCLKKGEKVWMVSIDICTINADGNLLDASALAALAALQNARFPEYVDDEVNYKKHTDEKLPMDKLPLPVTIHKIGNFFIVDPSREEEHGVEARLTITSTEKGIICALQKGGATLTNDEVAQMLELALEKSTELRKYF